MAVTIPRRRANPAARLLKRRLARLVATVMAVSFLTFMLTSLLPGDPSYVILGAEGVTPESLARVHRELHLDDPLPLRFVRWAGNALHGNLGKANVTQLPVSHLIAQRLPVTLELIAMAIVIALVISIPVGIFTAYRPKNPVARVISFISYLLLSVPSFVVGLGLILLFAIHWALLPAAGWIALSDDPMQNLKSAILPALALALPQVAVFSRILRGDMVATLDQDFVSFADSKGLSARRILLGHAFRPSSFSLLTLAGTSVGYLMGGTVIVETLFNLPGLGTLLVNAISQRDLFTVQGVTLFVAIAFVVVNFVVDMLYAVLDPRIRRGNGAPAV